jgi:hypothetical protein
MALYQLWRLFCVYRIKRVMPHCSCQMSGQTAPSLLGLTLFKIILSGGVAEQLRFVIRFFFFFFFGESPQFRLLAGNWLPSPRSSCDFPQFRQWPSGTYYHIFMDPWLTVTGFWNGWLDLLSPSLQSLLIAMDYSATPTLPASQITRPRPVLALVLWLSSDYEWTTYIEEPGYRSRYSD